MDELNNNGLNPQDNNENIPKPDAQQDTHSQMPGVTPPPYQDLNNVPYEQPAQNDNIYYGNDMQNPDNQVTYNSDYYGEPEPPAPKKGLAIAAMICGILSIVTCCIIYVSLPLSIVAIILSIICLVKKKDGKGMAIAGLICGIVGLVAMIGFYIYVFAVFGALADYYGLTIPQFLQEVGNGNITQDEITQATQEIMTSR